jgi:type I restriction enzyme S subunit
MSITLKNIPNDWQLKKLKDVSEFSNGKGHEQSIDENGQFIVVNSKFISTNGRVKKFSSQNLSPLNFGDITMVMSDIPNGKAIAKCFIIDKDNRYTLNQRICSIKSNKNCDTKFLYYVINRNRYYLAFDNGVSQTNFRRDEVLDCPVQFPPLPEQQKIAEILSTLDDKIEVIDQQITETQALKKGLMQRLLTKGIGHTEFKDSPLGEIPKSWKVVNIANIANVTAGGTPSTKEPTYWGGYIPWMNSGEINLRRIKSVEGRITDIGLKNSSTKIIPVNSVLMALAGQGKTRGKVAINEIPLCTNQSLATIYNFKNALHEYVFQNLESRYSEIRKMSTGDGGRGGLNLTIIKSIKLALPPMQEQEKISDLLKSFDDKLMVLEEKKTHYQELKQGLMQKLLTGKIRVK